MALQSLQRQRRQRLIAQREAEAGERRRHAVNPETKRGIGVVFLFVLGILSLMSLANIAGGLGILIKNGLRSLVGIPMIVLPVVILVAAWTLAKPKKYQVHFSHVLGGVLLVASISGFFHVFIPFDQAVSAIGTNRGGGYIGLAASYPLEKLMGPWATGVILAGVFIIALLLMFDTSLKALLERGAVFQRIGRRSREFAWRLKSNMDTTKEQAAPEQRVDTFARRDMASPTEPLKVETKSVVAGTEERPASPQQLGMFPSLKRKPRKISISFDLLDENGTKPMSGDIEANKERIRTTLANFGIPVEMGDVNVGPTVTQYTLKPSEGVKLAQLTTLSNDLALALAAHPIRIEAPIPGKALVGIEVPNKTVATVRLKQILKSEEFKKRRTNLSIALGLDVAGTPWIADLDSMPHLLIAGATGSGKSVCINSILLSLLYQNSPDELKLILVDPKRVEMPVYNNIPHLLTPVVTQVDKTINALRWVVAEMDRRFDVLSQRNKRNIQEYNQTADVDIMPYIVVVIDELADLMAVAMQEVEGAIIRLAQMARAVGIHLVVATQRPSVDVITGLIKANITSRIAFNVASVVDSRTILDVSGAEKLLGKGDMLFVTAQLSKPRRLQGVYVTNDEIGRVAEFLRQQAKPDYHPEVVEKLIIEERLAGNFEDLGDDELLAQAQELVVKTGKASASLLQRRLRVGYARAARLLDLLEERGVIGPGDGAKPREILVGRGEFSGTAEPADDIEDSEDGESTDDLNAPPQSEDDERYG